MRVIRIWNGNPIIMNVCRHCGIGAGKTVYPGGVVFVHAQAELRDGLCDDCWEHLRKTIDRLCKDVEKSRS
jgi:hypothetical protein